MGYFSELAQKYIDYDFDRSYPSPEQQLLWRLDDLNDKLAELKKSMPRIDRVYDYQMMTSVMLILSILMLLKS